MAEESRRKPDPVLGEMPKHVKERIADHVDAYTKTIVRLCSKELKSLADNAKVYYSWLKIKLNLDGVEVRVHYNFNELARVSVVFHNYGGCLEAEYRNLGMRKLMDRRDYEEAIRTVAKMLNNSNCSFGTITVEDVWGNHPQRRIRRNRFYLELGRNLWQLQNPLDVEEVRGDARATSLLLRRTKPGLLKKICVESDHSVHDFRSLVDFEQWRQAKSIIIRVDSDLKLADVLHADSIELQMRNIGFDDFEKLIEIASGPVKKSFTLRSSQYSKPKIDQFLEDYPYVQENYNKLYTLDKVTVTTKLDQSVDDSKIFVQIETREN